MASVETATPASIINGSKAPSGGSGGGGRGSEPPQTIQPQQQQQHTPQQATIAPNIIGNGNAATAASSFNTPTKQQRFLNNNGKRIEIDGMMSEFQKLLGSNWDRYRDTVTNFLIGKLTRMEFQQELDEILDKNLIHMHNQFLLANLANALRDAPQNENGVLSGWSKKNSDSPRNVKGDTQLSKIKEDIMQLTVRERKRIKAIGKDQGKQQPPRPTQTSSVVQTRQAMLPRLPYVSDKDKKQQQNNQPASSPSVQASPSQNQNNASSSPQVSSQTTTTAQPVNWTQDILHAYEAPLSTESYELPDIDSLNLRLLGISLEHGLLNGVGNQVSELMITGLECFLKDLVQQVVNRVKLRKQPGEEGILTAEDVSDVLQSSPTCFVEMTGPTYRLQDVVLVDDDYDVAMQEAPEEGADYAVTPELDSLINELISPNN